MCDYLRAHSCLLASWLNELICQFIRWKFQSPSAPQAEDHYAVWHRRARHTSQNSQWFRWVNWFCAVLTVSGLLNTSRHTEENSSQARLISQPVSSNETLQTRLLFFWLNALRSEISPREAEIIWTHLDWVFRKTSCLRVSRVMKQATFSYYTLCKGSDISRLKRRV